MTDLDDAIAAYSDDLKRFAEAAGKQEADRTLEEKKRIAQAYADYRGGFILDRLGIVIDLREFPYLALANRDWFPADPNGKQRH